MSGAYSSRPMLSLAPLDDAAAAINLSRWWARDVRRLLARRDGLRGIALVWPEPWPEGQALSIDRLDPLFIEVCRRVRLAIQDDRLMAARGTSRKARIAAEESRGVISDEADPWAPIIDDGETKKTVRLGERDFTYAFLFNLLNGRKTLRPYLAQPGAEETFQPMALVAEAFSRGQSKTDGFRSRIVPIPRGVVQTFFGPLAVAVAETMFEDIKHIEDSLSGSLALVAAEGDFEKRKKINQSQSAQNKLKKTISEPLSAFDRRVDQRFFPALCAHLQAEGRVARTEARRAFIRELCEEAETEFERALPAIPCVRLMRPRAELRGRRALHAGLRKAMAKVGEKEAENA